MGLAPIHDVVIIIAGRDCAAHHQEQHLRQGISHPPLLAGVSHRREMVQQATQARLLAECFHPRGSHPSELPRNHEPRCPLRAVNPSSWPWPTLPLGLTKMVSYVIGTSFQATATFCTALGS